MLNHSQTLEPYEILYFILTENLGKLVTKPLSGFLRILKFNSVQNCGQGFHIILVAFLTECWTWFLHNPGQISQRLRNRIIDWRFWLYSRNNSYRILRWIFANRHTESSYTSAEFPNNIGLVCDKNLEQGFHRFLN